ncbi:hypothetical protein FV113G1_23820 [Fusobacterium varium]|nr:hypothetical protein FV113G1_23820 [Fusobacterium varium]
MIKAGDRVIYNVQADYDECEGIPLLRTVEEVIKTKNNIYYKLDGVDDLVFEDDIEEIISEGKEKSLSEKMSSRLGLITYLIFKVSEMKLQDRCCNPGESWGYVVKVLYEESDPKVFWEYIGNIVSEIQKFVK